MCMHFCDTFKFKRDPFVDVTIRIEPLGFHILMNIVNAPTDCVGKMQEHRDVR